MIAYNVVCVFMCAHVKMPAELCAKSFSAIFAGISTIIQQSGGKKIVAKSRVIVRLSICERLKKPEEVVW